MPGYDDDEDWVGTPPEGRISRDRADPGFWWTHQRPLSIAGAGLLFVIVVLLIVAAVS